tara:strand:- start:1120 stop:1332 length:213 start_codon:yes stop_codon:yes gene_type:complete
MKAPKVPVPKVDPELAEREKAAEAELQAEKDRAMKIQTQGRRATILTSGQGLQEEASARRTVLGSGSRYG